MLDLKFVRENIDLIKKNLENRGTKLDLSDFIKLEEDRRERIKQLDDLLHKKNIISSEISKLKKEGKDTKGKIEEIKKEDEQINNLEVAIRLTEDKISEIMFFIPNIHDKSVPIGKHETSNVEIRKFGTPPEFDFTTLPHWDLGEMLGILDFERASRMSGARFVLYKGLGAKLERALINFMLDLHTKKHGYLEIIPPLLVSEKSMIGTGQLPRFKNELYKCADDDLYLIPTAEVSLTNIHREEVLNANTLPLKYVAYTPCFRREAGSYGKDTRGIVRLHQFNKVELMKFTKPEDSFSEFESLLKDAEEVLKRLELHYRVVMLCTGELGFGSAKTYDIEVWLPSLNSYKEISSCGNFTDFQARRSNIKLKRERGSKLEYVHTLNGSGLAIGRTFLAILENYQEKDGSVRIPEVLIPYMDGIDKITKE